MYNIAASRHASNRNDHIANDLSAYDPNATKQRLLDWNRGVPASTDCEHGARAGATPLGCEVQDELYTCAAFDGDATEETNPCRRKIALWVSIKPTNSLSQDAYQLIRAWSAHLPPAHIPPMLLTCVHVRQQAILLDRRQRRSLSTERMCRRGRRHKRSART